MKPSTIRRRERTRLEALVRAAGGLFDHYDSLGERRALCRVSFKDRDGTSLGITVRRVRRQSLAIKSGGK